MIGAILGLTMSLAGYGLDGLTLLNAPSTDG